MTLQSIGFKVFAKIMKESCAFCCSGCISFNPSHLNYKNYKQERHFCTNVLKENKQNNFGKYL